MPIGFLDHFQTGAAHVRDREQVGTCHDQIGDGRVTQGVHPFAILFRDWLLSEAASIEQRELKPIAL